MPSAHDFAILHLTVAAVQRILAIDADPATLSSVKGILESDERVVTLAQSAAEARAALDRESFDLVVADLQMPDLPGEALFQYCEARRVGSGARILYLVAGQIPAELQSFIERTHRPCLPKPIHLRRFVDRAEDILTGVEE